MGGKRLLGDRFVKRRVLKISIQLWGKEQMRSNCSNTAARVSAVRCRRTRPDGSGQFQGEGKGKRPQHDADQAEGQ